LDDQERVSLATKGFLEARENNKVHYITVQHRD